MELGSLLLYRYLFNGGMFVLGFLAGTCLGISLELGLSLLLDIKNWRERIAKFLLFVVLFFVTEFILYRFMMGDIFFKGIVDSSGLPVYYSLQPKYFYNDYYGSSFAFSLIGYFIYSFLQIPYSIYWYVKKDKEKGKRAIIRMLLLLGLGISVFNIYMYR
jgi:hypothetical protein